MYINKRLGGIGFFLSHKCGDIHLICGGENEKSKKLFYRNVLFLVIYQETYTEHYVLLYICIYPDDSFVHISQSSVLLYI